MILGIFMGMAIGSVIDYIYIISLQKEYENLVRENAILANRIDVLEKEKGD